MEDATLRQGTKVLDLIVQKKTAAKRLQELFPYMSDMLDEGVIIPSREEFRKLFGLGPVRLRRSRKGKNILVVDYSIKPSLINLVIDSHPDRADSVRINPKKVERVSMLRSGESSISGHEYLRRLQESGKELHDIRVMEEFLKNPEKIPEEWKSGRTYFWGTIFRIGGHLCVAYLYWDGDRWYWNYSYLDNDWYPVVLAAVAASN